MVPLLVSFFIQYKISILCDILQLTLCPNCKITGYGLHPDPLSTVVCGKRKFPLETSFEVSVEFSKHDQRPVMSRHEMFWSKNGEHTWADFSRFFEFNNFWSCPTSSSKCPSLKPHLEVGEWVTFTALVKPDSTWQNNTIAWCSFVHETHWIVS